MPGTFNAVTSPERHTSRLLASTVGVRIETVVIDPSAIDPTNLESTSILREGLILGKVDATGMFKRYDPAAADGTQNPANVCILMGGVDMAWRQDGQAVVAPALRAGAVHKDAVYGDYATIVSSATAAPIDFRDR